MLGIALKQTDTTSALWSIFKWWFSSRMMSGLYHRTLVVGRDLRRSLGPLLLTRQTLMLDQCAPGHVQMIVQCFEWWRFCTCSEPLLQFWTLHWESIFFHYMQSECLLLVLIAASPFTGPFWEESGSFLYTLPFIRCKEESNSPWAFSSPGSTDPPLRFSFYVLCSSPQIILVDLHCTHSSTSVSVWEPKTGHGTRDVVTELIDREERALCLNCSLLSC